MCVWLCYFAVPLGDDVLKPSPRCSLCSAPFTHSFIRIHLTVLTALCNKSRGASAMFCPESVLCLRVEAVSRISPATQRLPPGGEAASWLLAKDTASTDLITTCAFSALQPWGTGVNAAPTLTYSQKPALLLFIYSSSPPSLFCLLHLLPLVSRRLQDWLHYPCLFFSHPSHSLRDVNKSDSRDRWNDRISLSAGSLATFPSSLFDSHLLSSVWLRLQQHILLDLVSTF